MEVMRGQEDRREPRLLHELCALVLGVLRSPFSEPLPAAPSRRSVPAVGRPRVSPAELASLLLGMSLALMLSGWVTFVIGFMLMPWVLGMFVVFYLVGIVTSLSVLGRSILCLASAPRKSPRKEMAGSLFKFQLFRCRNWHP